MKVPDLSKCRVVVLGDAMLDEYTEAGVSRVSPEAAAPVALLGGTERVPGGAANAAANLAALGCRTVLVSAMGTDPACGNLQALLAERGVDSRPFAAPEGGRPTTVKTRIMAQGRQLVRLDRETKELLEPAQADALWAKAEAALAEGADCALLSDYGKGVVRSACSDGVPIGRKLIEACRARRIPVLVDPKTPDWSVYAGATCIMPNEAEFRIAMGMPDDAPFKALASEMDRAMEKTDAGRILLTRAENGMALFERGRTSEPVLAGNAARHVADVCGAGDTAGACLAACIGAGMEWGDAARMANLAGGLAVEKQGTSTVSIDELKAAAGEAPAADAKAKAAPAARAMTGEVPAAGAMIKESSVADAMAKFAGAALKAPRPAEMKASRFSGCKVVVLGDAMLDEYVKATVSRVSPEASAPVALLGETERVPGGAANAAANLAALGCRTVLVSAMGTDPACGNLQALLAERGVDSRPFAAPAGGRPTTVKTRIMAQGRQLVRLDRETKEHLEPAQADALWAKAEAALEGADCALLSDYGKGVVRSACSDGVPIGRKLIEACRARRIPVLVDPKTPDWSVYAGATCIMPNEAEFRLAMGMPNDAPFKALASEMDRAMEKTDAGRILLTRAENGMALFERGRTSEPVLAGNAARHVADVCGAGDTAGACLAACIGSGMEWEAAARMANLAGGLAVEKQGTSTVSADELQTAAKARAMEIPSMRAPSAGSRLGAGMAPEWLCGAAASSLARNAAEESAMRQKA